MKRKKRRPNADERPSRKRSALRHIEDKEWEEELRYVDSSLEIEDDLPAWRGDEEIPDESDWVP